VGRTARMGAAGKAFTLVTPQQGDELTKVETLINMVIPLAQLEGFNASPPPSDWTDLPPGSQPQASTPSKPVASRFDRAYGSTATNTGSDQAPVALPPRTLGSKIPITRRHKRRR